MAETKYGRYLTRDCIKPNIKKEGAYVTSTRHLETFGGSDCTIDCIYITSPHLMTLGEEREKHTITSPTAAYIPAGLYHGPLNFAKINKPVLFLDLALSGRYSRVEDTKK
jgi:hypothetical protein